MTVSTINNRVSYAGNGVTTVFSFPNKFLADADLVVLDVLDSTGAETVKTLTTHYTVSGAGDAAGGSVTMLTAPASGHTLVIYRDPALTQPIDLVNGDPLNVDTGIERGLDRATTQVQRVRDLIDRSLRLPDGDVGFVAADMVLPAKVTRASKLLAFDADGKPMASSGTGGAATSAFMATLLDDTTAAAALATLGLPDYGARQTVTDGSVDASGDSDFLSAGTGLAVSRAATATPVIVTAANGADASGPVNYRSRFSADQADYWSGLPAYNVSYLFDDMDAGTLVWSAYDTLVPPQYSKVFKPNVQAQLDFTGADASTAFTDAYGNIWTAVGNAQINANKLLLDGTGDGISSSDITTLGSGSWTLEADVIFNALPGDGVAQVVTMFVNAAGHGVNLGVYNTAGVITTRIYLSSTGTSADIAASSLGVKTAWATATKYHFCISYDAVAGKYFVYVDGVQDNAVTSSEKICPISVARIGVSPSATSGLNGRIDNFRLSPCARYPNGVTFTPPTGPFVPDAEWFDLSTFKWKYGSSASWAEKVRVCVGEAKTGAASVTTATTYPAGRDVVMLPPERDYWLDKAALLDPDAYTSYFGATWTFTVPAGETWYLVNAWHGQFGGSIDFMHRSMDVNEAFPLPAGTTLSAYSSASAFAYVCQPRAVIGQAKYAAPKELYYKRLDRLRALTLTEITATIESGAAAATSAGATFPTDFDNGLLVHSMVENVAWTILVDSSGGAGLSNTHFEISDQHQLRVATVCMAPWRRTVMPKMLTKGASVSGNATDTCVAGRGSLHYYKLPSDW